MMADVTAVPCSPAALASGATIDGIFRRAFRIYRDRVAVTWEDGRLTYGELGARAWRLANGLRSLGYARGDRIAVLSEPRPEYIEAYIALSALGIAVVALNVRLHPDELSACLDKCRPAAVLVSGSCAELAGRVRAQTHSVRDWLSLDPSAGYGDYGALLRGSPEAEPPLVAEAADIHNILFTSGTTGRPKGALISQQAAAVRGLRLAQWFGLGERDGSVGWLPLFHCAGNESLYATFLTGGTYATLRRADIAAMFRLIERDRLSWTLLLPGVISHFLDDPSRAGHDLSSLRFAIGYANMMPRLVARLTAAFGIDFYDAFGQSETSYLVAHGRSGPGELPTLRKTPAPLMEIRIVDDDMNEQPVGTPGECVVRGPSLMSGYFEDDRANAEVFHGGWLHTGDVLVREADGMLRFVDRKRYLIKTGGENVYPAEVECVIAQHPDVEEVCVFGVADAQWGEAIKATIVLRTACAATPEDIVAWCRPRLSAYKCPRYVQFLRQADVPRSLTGKIIRQALSELPVTADQRAR